MNKAALTPDQLRILLKTFKERHGLEYGLAALGYIGSYARNSATPDSDVDIVFETDRPNLFMTSMMRKDLETMLGRPVQVLQLR